MKRRICDLIIGQVLLAVTFVLFGIAYEGIYYIDFDDILPYIQIALIQLVVGIPVSVSVFYTAVNGIEYFKNLTKDIETRRQAEGAKIN